jgi:hypothetical protein
MVLQATQDPSVTTAPERRICRRKILGRSPNFSTGSQLLCVRSVVVSPAPLAKRPDLIERCPVHPRMGQRSFLSRRVFVRGCGLSTKAIAVTVPTEQGRGSRSRRRPHVPCLLPPSASRRQRPAGSDAGRLALDVVGARFRAGTPQYLARGSQPRLWPPGRPRKAIDPRGDPAEAAPPGGNGVDDAAPWRPEQSPPQTCMVNLASSRNPQSWGGSARQLTTTDPGAVRSLAE